MSTPEHPYNKRGGAGGPSLPGMKQLLDGLRQLRESLAQGRRLIPPHQKSVPRWDLHEKRLREMELLAATGGGPRDAERFAELHEDFMLDYQADMAASMAESAERLVRFNDMLVVRMEEKKFELSSEQREGLDEILEPYKDTMREEMLKTLPIETLRQIEAEKRRLEEEGTGLD